jgi:cold shock protein
LRPGEIVIICTVSWDRSEHAVRDQGTKRGLSLPCVAGVEQRVANRFGVSQGLRPGVAFCDRRPPTMAGCLLGVHRMSGHPGDQLNAIEGVVKWFDPRKGFGFIVGPEGQDIFVHFTVIEGDGFRVLRDGGKVIYDAVRGDKGWKATKVHRPRLEVVLPQQRGYTRSPRR